MDIEDFFIRTIDDLQTKSKSGTEYDAIRACGLLRQLLLDSPSLIVLANKKHKIKFKFLVHVTPFIDPGFPIIEILDIDEPYNKELHEVFVDGTEVSLGAFLNTRCLTLREYHYTVHNVITSGAHTYGGIHASSDTVMHKEFNLRESTTKLNDCEELLFTRTVKSISRIVIAATSVLVEKIKTSAGGF